MPPHVHRNAQCVGNYRKTLVHCGYIWSRFINEEILGGIHQQLNQLFTNVIYMDKQLFKLLMNSSYYHQTTHQWQEINMTKFFSWATSKLFSLIALFFLINWQVRLMSEWQKCRKSCLSSWKYIWRVDCLEINLQIYLEIYTLLEKFIKMNFN